MRLSRRERREIGMAGLAEGDNQPQSLHMNAVMMSYSIPRAESSVVILSLQSPPYRPRIWKLVEHTDNQQIQSNESSWTVDLLYGL